MRMLGGIVGREESWDLQRRTPPSRQNARFGGAAARRSGSLGRHQNARPGDATARYGAER